MIRQHARSYVLPMGCGYAPTGSDGPWLARVNALAFHMVNQANTVPLKGLMMNIKAIRTAANPLPAVAVFGVAAVQSYAHTVEVATHYGEASSAHLMPFSIDGLMVIAARYISHARTKTARAVALVAFVMGFLAMAGINVLAADPNPISRAIAIWPALAMALAGALLHWAPQKPTATRRRRTPAKKPATNVRRLKTAQAA